MSTPPSSDVTQLAAESDRTHDPNAQGSAGDRLGDFAIIESRDPAVLIIRYDRRNNSVLFIHNLDSKPREVKFSIGLTARNAAAGRLLVQCAVRRPQPQR